MDLRRLECFVAVAELLSFRQAAERLHLSRSPLTRQIVALEGEVGVRLLERGRRRAVVLTDAGRAFLTHARQALQSVAAAARSARDAAGGGGGRLVIAGCATPAAPMLAAHLRAFRLRWPGVEVSFVEATHVEERSVLKEGRAHLAISADFGAASEPFFCSRKLSVVGLAVVVPTCHPAVRRAEAWLTAETMNGETLLCPTPAGTLGYREFLRDLQQRTGFEPRETRPVDGVDNILTMVAAGYGVAILPAQLVSRPPPGCRTKRLRLPAPGYRLRMLWPRDSKSDLLHNFLHLAGGRTLPPSA